MDNCLEGYRTSDGEDEGAAYSLISLELAEREIAKIKEAAAAAEGEVAAAREAELDELMEAQLLEAARGGGMDHDEEEQLKPGELPPWDLGA